jgi:TPR repeat protein
MFSKKSSKSDEKYIPPHRRAQPSSSSTLSSTTTSTAVIHSNNQTQARSNPRFFTSHAKLRQEQRSISSSSVNHTLHSGARLEAAEATVHIDEQTQVVVSKDGGVITVSDNTRNTRFDIRRISKDREQYLWDQVQFKNNDFAMCELAELYLKGDLGNREVKTAYDLYLRAAEKGNSHAMCLIAKMHQEGDLGKIDLTEANRWIEKAAARNNKFALAIIGQRCLGEYRQQKTNDPESNNLVLLNKAKNYLQRAARKGSTRAMWHLAKIHEEGIDGVVNLEEAIAIYTDAARQGSPASLQVLQGFVKKKKIKPEQFEDILDQASSLIARTSSELAIDIGLEQIMGSLGTTPARGFWMLEQAGEKGNERALSVLIKCYRYGVGGKPDQTRYQDWTNKLRALYETAIRKGNVNAMLDLGDLYLKGAFSKIDLESARKLFIQAANSGDIDSIYYLGWLYLNGRLGNHDPAEGNALINKSITLWQKRALQGDHEAALELVDVYLNKDIGFKNYNNAAHWLSHLARKDNKVALIKLLSLFFKKKINFKYENGSCIFSDELMALIQKMVSEGKNPKALLFLIIFYRNGFVLPEDKPTDVNIRLQELETALFSLALQQTSCALMLGKFYKTGSFLPKDLQLAAKWLTLANCPTESNPHSISAEVEFNSLIISKEWGENEKKLILKGILEAAAICEKKEPYRIGRILGDLYSKNQFISSDFSEAIKWYEQAANLGNSLAMYQLGLLYQTTAVGEINIKESVKWLLLSAKEDNNKARQELEKLSQSDSTPADIKITIDEYLELPVTTETNHPSIQLTEETIKLKSLFDRDPVKCYQRAKNCREGSNGETKDIQQAAYWYRKAASKGHAEAEFELAELYHSGQLGDTTKSVAVNLFKNAAKKKHLPAFKALIEAYSNGMLIKPNPEKVQKWQTREKILLARENPQVNRMP